MDAEIEKSANLDEEDYQRIKQKRLEEMGGRQRSSK